MKLRSLGIAALLFTAQALALGGREAAADHVFQLADVMFSDGGTATGAFTTNDALTALVTYDITTSTVSGFPGFEYTPATAPAVNNKLPSQFGLFDGPMRSLSLGFGGSGLTATGATLGTNSFELNAAADNDRFVVSGSVVGVPEPSALVLGGLAAAAGLGLWAWRRRVASRVG